MHGRRPLILLLALGAFLVFAGSALASGTDSWTQWTASPQETWIRSLDFTAASTLVASSDGDGVFQAPATLGPWAQTNSGLDTPGDKNVLQVVASGGKLYAATLSGLFTAAQSPNPSWTQLSPGPGNNTLDMGGIQSVVVESPSALVVAVAGAAGPGVYTSSDAGATWHRAAGMPDGENIFFLAKGAGPLVYAAGDSGVWTSVDGGASWTLTSDGINTTGTTTFRVAVGPGPNEVWAANGSGVYRSDDAGVTWRNSSGSGATALPTSQVNHAFLLAPSLQTADVIVGTNDGVWASNDGGTSWGQMSPDAAGFSGTGVFGTRIIWALGVGFSPPALLAGTQGFGVYSLPLAPVTAPSSFSVSPNSGLNAGDMLTANPSWNGTLPIFYKYQWKRCPSNINCADVQSGGDGPTYTIPDTDANTFTTYEVQICATNLLTPAPVCKLSNKTSGSIPPQSGQEPIFLHGINDSSLSPDPNVSYPWGQTFTVNEGHWALESDASTQITPALFDYEWERCDQFANCAVIPGATNQSYTTTPADVGFSIRAHVRALYPLFGPVGSQFYEVGNTFTIIEKTPVNTLQPKIIGSPVVGTTLQSTAGAWDAHDPTYTRRWLRCDSGGLGCQPLQPAQTNHAYTLTSADLGSRLEVEITATQADPSQNRVSVVDSLPTGVVVNPGGPPPPPKTTPTPKPPVVKLSLPHKLVLGAKLTGPSRETGFARIAYQWLRNGKAIRHATHRTYKLTRADLGKKISLRLTLTTSAGKKVVATSRAVRIPKPKPKHRRKRHR
jgi:hypothetical protein